MNSIVLIGYMGSGKTTLGRKLARVLNLPFVDTDTEIEKKENKTINSIFQEHGESYFRSLERAFIAGLDPSQPIVLSTGGGLPCFNDNMSKLNEIGLTIYLERSPKELMHRLINARVKRPLIEKMDEAELLEFIETTLEKRKTHYLMANIIAKRSEQTVKELLVKINERI